MTTNTPHEQHSSTAWATRMPVLRARKEVASNTSAWVNIRTMPAWAGIISLALRPHQFSAFSKEGL